MSYPVAIIFILGVIAALIAFRYFDVAIKSMHDDHRDEWEKTGRPSGFFWAAPGNFDIMARMASNKARGAFIRRWLFSTPKWFAPGSAGRTSLMIFRLLTAFVLVAFGVCTALIVRG